MRILKQIGFIFGICLVGQIIAELIPVPFPGSVMSMVLLFILFMLNWANPEKLKNVNDFLLENMFVFFVPSAVSIITKYDLNKKQYCSDFDYLCCFVCGDICCNGLYSHFCYENTRAFQKKKNWFGR